MTPEIIHGDVFDLLPGLGDDTAHAAVVDYPWQFQKEQGTGYFGNEDNGWSDFDQFQTEDAEALAVVLDELARVLVEGSWVFVFADDDVLPDFRETVEQSPLERRRTLVWDRCTIGIGQYFRSRHMFIVAATVGKTDRYVRDRPTVLEATRQDGFLRKHDYPTGKPPSLYRKMLAPPVLEEGETLLEPFCGGAPGAAIAAERGLGYWAADVNPGAIKRALAAFEQQRFGQTTVSDGGFVPANGGGNGRYRSTDSDHPEPRTDGGMVEPRYPRFAGRLEQTRGRLSRTRRMLRENYVNEDLVEAVSRALAEVDVALAIARGDDESSEWEDRP